MGKASDTVSPTGSGNDPDEAAVLDYLLRNPDFLKEHPDVLLLATPPQRFESSEGKVVDIQHVMLKRLQTEMADLQDCAEQLIITTRSNMATQKGTLQAALAVLESEGIDGLALTIAEDLPLFLDVDVCTLRIEQGLPGVPPAIATLPPGLMGRTFETDDMAALRPLSPAESVIYGATASEVRSDALVRLTAADGQPLGILALGSRLEGTFEPDMALDLLLFLARVVENCLRRRMPPR
ncbi:DUF484 family protein [Pararhodospirillum photometricum]|nr:DUF484 family protein [Pararhodospirillum photometricum]